MQTFADSQRRGQRRAYTVVDDMAYFFVYLSLLLVSSHSVWATRFLPTIVWDHLNPLLSCECNWLVIPDVDQYDQQQFTCPTSKIYANLLDGYFRTNTERNENILRREWRRTKDDLLHSIKNGSINSFCDPASPDTTVLHTCKDGLYSSAEVTYKYNDVPSKMYSEDKIYVFFNNGDDGRAATLQSKKARCTMFFAVYVTAQKKTLYGMDFGKPALTGSQNCKLSKCPLATETPSITTPHNSSSTTTSSRSSTRLRSTTRKQDAPTTSTQHTATTRKHAGPYHTTGKTNTSSSILKPVTKNPKIPVPCSDTWLNYTIFVVFVIVAFVAGVVCTIFAFAVKNALNKRDHYSRNGEANIHSPTHGSPQTECRLGRQETKGESIYSHKL